MFNTPSRRYPHLYHHILGNIPNKYPVMAYGSWATFEAHLPDAVNGEVSLLSDVDYVTESDFVDELSCIIKAEVDKFSQVHSVNIVNVSVRRSQTINNLWPSKLRDDTGSRFDYDRYAVFWTMMGIIELSALAKQNNHMDGSVASYGTVKFFFRLARNLLHRAAADLSTYHSLARSLAGFCPSHSLAMALQIKIGMVPELPIDDLHQLFSPGFYALINDTISGCFERELVISTCHLVSKWCNDPLPLTIQDYVTLGESYVQDDFQMDALKRAISKLEKSDVHF